MRAPDGGEKSPEGDSLHACRRGMRKFVVTFGGAGLIKCFDLYGYRRGGTFESPKVPKSDLG